MSRRPRAAGRSEVRAQREEALRCAYRRLLDVPVPVGGDGYLGGLVDVRRVQAPLQLAEHGAEEGVPPGGLGEGATVAGQRRQVAAGRVIAVGQAAEGPQGEM